MSGLAQVLRDLKAHTEIVLYERRRRLLRLRRPLRPQNVKYDDNIKGGKLSLNSRSRGICYNKPQTSIFECAGAISELNTRATIQLMKLGLYSFKKAAGIDVQTIVAFV